MRPCHAFHAVETLRNSFSVTLRRKGVVLTDNDSATVLDVYQQLVALMIDLDYLHPETLKRDARRLWADMVQADVFDLNSAFAECLQCVRMQDFRGFKGLCSRISSHLYPMVKRDKELAREGDVIAAGRLIQLFSYTSRLSLNDIDLTQQLLESYLENEEAIPQEYPDEILQRLNRIIRRWIGPFCPGEIHPYHGPGGIAEHGRCALEAKYNCLATDQRLEYAFGNPWWLSGNPSQHLNRTSRTVFVPKSYKTFRTISMEPTTLQYFQQGVWRQVESLVDSNQYLRNHIGFREQERNRKLAQEGSINRNYATIDLSAASDSVGYELVKRLFRGTWLSRYIVATRSTHTLLPDGRVIELKKFAPMGSALCFPIETIVFASICEYVTRAHRFAGKYSVFGDDIIVPTPCVEETIDILQRLGFHVNHDKSYYQPTCWFRESCGGEYVDGFDVTPMKVSRKYASREQDVRFDKLIALSNTAYLKGYRHLRYFFLMKIRRSYGKVLFSPQCLLADSYSNYHAKKRWNPNLQRIEVRVDTLISKYTKDNKASQDESIRYRHWLESTSERSTLGDGYESVICRPTVVTKRTWMPKPYELSDQEFIDQHTGRG
ncbi:TPA_asm: RNA-directed RNA polymerase [ssRNA phage SRR7976310_3]|uniref:RNA-directed RNA polymerase n=1 Tax=ssRNA phage SRR7976310_3 TaxID=2786681 RepID=A0A8S5L5K3_9VIRU|nr:RNA-directed RNA polymerase [ssRNA phage SRR7976310_3]DAD52703.1 TPA_asm: RNA-directed RNA polymerase [ssRNA phage SRR7976310_3]